MENMSMADIERMYLGLRLDLLPEETETHDDGSRSFVYENGQFRFEAIVDEHDWITGFRVERSGETDAEPDYADFAEELYGWVGFTDVPYEEMVEHLKAILSHEEICWDAVSMFLDGYKEDWKLAPIAFRYAVRHNEQSFVEYWIQSVDVNDELTYSTYLDETDDEDILSLLETYGAVKNPDYYCEQRFAVEIGEGQIYAFDEDLQKEAFGRYLKEYSLTEQDILKALLADSASTDEGTEKIREDMRALGIVVKDGALSYIDRSCGKSNGILDLLEELGYDCEREGDDCGYYVIY